MIFTLGVILFAANQIIKGNAETNKILISPNAESFSVFALLTQKVVKSNDYIIYGYLPYWNLVDADFLHYDKLTDIAYFGLYINPDGTFKQRTDDGSLEPGYRNWYENTKVDEIIQESERKGVRFALTIIAHVDDESTQFLNCKACWKTLVDNTEKELLRKGIKDVNLNFEYASYVEEETADKYTEFVTYFNKEIDERMGGSYVVVSTFADSVVKPRITKIKELTPVSDGLFIMAYDFHRPSSDNAGPVSPIDGIGVHAEYDIRTMMKDYLEVSDPKKIILGVPYYGYNWVVTKPESYAPRIEGNDYVGYSQSQSYSAIMDTILENGPIVNWDELGKVPYFSYVSSETGSFREVYFENKQSLKVKYELAKINEIAGIGIWALGYDGGYQELWGLLGEEFFN
jgi:spore germination protein YaaH